MKPSTEADSEAKRRTSMPLYVHHFARRVKRALLGNRSLGRNALSAAYYRVLNLLSLNCGIATTVNGLPLRLDAQSLAVVNEVWEKEAFDFLSERVQPGETCIDVGANIGLYVLQFGRWTAPDGRIHAFEPNQEAFAILSRNVGYNRLSSRVTLNQAAVGASVGVAELFACGFDGRSRLERPASRLERTSTPLQVPMTTLDQYCADKGFTPNWVLIDVEGFEWDVLAGAKRILTGANPPKLIVEIHPDPADPAAFRARGEKLLEDYHLTIKAIGEQRSPLEEYGLVYLERRSGRGAGVVACDTPAMEIEISQ